MSSETTLFGLSMQTRRRRRLLVIAVYSILLIACVGAGLFSRRDPVVASWVIYIALGLSFFILGGYGRRGLVKNFADKPPQENLQVDNLVNLGLAATGISRANDRSWKNDERELSRRDNAHYRAYAWPGVAMMAILLLSEWALRPFSWMNPQMLLQAIFTVALLGAVLFLTLPSAIILWREPDLP